MSSFFPWNGQPLFTTNQFSLFRYNKATAAKQEQTAAMLSLKDQMSAMAVNYDMISKEAASLKEENVKLKEEGSQMVTNIHSLKESNLKLHEVMEEMLDKISGM